MIIQWCLIRFVPPTLATHMIFNENYFNDTVCYRLLYGIFENFNKLNNKLTDLVDENKKLKKQYKNIQENQELKKKA